MTHPDHEVQSALTRLLDALCTWERETGRRSVLVLREQYGFEVRAESGKPINITGLTDAEIFDALRDDR